MYTDLGGWRLVGAGLLFAGVIGGGSVIYTMGFQPATAYPLVIQRAVTIVELNEGYKVECRQDRNPYPYAEYAKDTLDDALVKVRMCITKRAMAIPEEYKRR